MTERLRGIVAPILTPFEDGFEIAEELCLEHAASCLAAGVHYISPFGTTSEALSLSPGERMRLLERLAESGAAAPERMMPGTGLCALPETLELSRHAVDLGCAAILVLPPFFFSNATDEGLYRHFAALIEGIGSDRLRLCLYHIPQMAGVGISPALAARLAQAYPGIVAAYKDSSGDWENTQAVIAAAPGVSVFPGSETLMVEAMRLGGGGCISASCNSNAGAIRALFDLCDAGRWEEAQAALGPVEAHRQAVLDGGIIPALKSLKAHLSGDSRWLNLRPPLENADPAIGPALKAALDG